MLFVTQTTSPAKRDAAYNYLQSHEEQAASFAAQCSPGDLVKIGPMQKQKNGATFELCAASGEMLVPLVVLVAAGMPEADTWFTWALVLEKAGLRVREDAAYREVCYGEMYRLEA